MATAQQMPPGPRSARLADDAATAALYATQPRRKAPVRDAPVSDNKHLNTRATRATTDLSHASAASALAHANQKPIEIWRPGRLTDAEKAASHVKDFSPPQIPQKSTQYSAEGLGAAILAVREQRAMTGQSPNQQATTQHDTSRSDHNQDKALRAATGAYAARQRADSAPIEPVNTTDSDWALSAAGLSHRAQRENEGPLAHLDNAMEQSRITHAKTNARLYTSSPPVSSEVQERNRRNSLHAAALVMARDMYDITGPTGEAPNMDHAVSAAQKGQSQLQARKTVSGATGSAGRRALILQEAAQKRAAEKLARMRDEHAEMQQYYGTAPQPQRSLLSARRKRTSSDADETQVDAEQSRQIHKQMFSLRNKMNKVDEKRQKDRDLLMEAARRNVDAQIHDMEMKVYADTGRAPPSIQKQWDEAASEKVRQEAEAAEAKSVPADRVNIGASRYMDMADVEAVARTRVQPALDEITDQAERRRAEELEARLDAEEQQRQAAIQREREASLSRAEHRDGVSEKRGSKGLKFFSWKRKSKQPHEEKADVNKEAAAHEAAADERPTEEAQVAQGAVAAPETKEAPAAAPEVREPAVAAAPEPAVTAAPEPAVVAAHEPVAVAPEPAVIAAPEPKDKAKPEEAAVSAPSEAVRQDSGMPSTSGMTNVEGAAPISPPVNLTYEPTQDDDRPSMLRSQTGPRDAAATGGVSTLHKNQAITSPRADSKLKTWFRDRLIRRTSEPQPLYPHQPGPEYSDSESAFTGGAALTGRIEPRGAALSSHPVSTEDLESEHGEYGGVTEESTNNQQVAQNGNSNETSKRHRLRRSWLKTVSRNSQELKTNGTEHPNQSSEAVPTSELRGLRDSAVEQGLPAPPVLGDSLSIRRESRFSEDL
ncbi:hypothetical protein PEBR_32365 [Penicillium brasilianum]|uniref:Eisosome protein 1 n=1 Tax=Penicillium brasilianum TaxID=104259 RepID=A0A1S9RF45_PENBI|nr:hypothetical protein PEBR_32365 [Penicillium brasilianum]